ncbi:MAG: phosphoenolpyruvate carboxylase, partial [Wenzhouxiangellaceae bacterium]
LQAVLGGLRDQGMAFEEFEPLLDEVLLEPVLTAHPTEATRRSILEKEQRMARYLIQRFDSNQSQRALDRLLDRVRMELTIAWQTAEQSQVRPTVADEAEHAHYYLANVLYRIAPVLHEHLAEAIQEVWGVTLEPGRLPSILRFGSWVGGDMDGNPNVGPDTVLDTLAEQRRQVVSNYLRESARLNRLLSQTLSRIEITPELGRRLKDYGERMPEVRRRIPKRYADMPYRGLLYFIEHRLRKTLRDDDDGAYGGPEALLEDLGLIADSLRAHRGTRAGLFPLDRLRRRVGIFGFHLAALDLRVDSEDLHAAVAELRGDPDWSSRVPDQRAVGDLGGGAGGGGATAQPGDATWLHRFFDSEFWTTPGGDFEPTASAFAPLDGGIGTFAFESSPALIADVQSWVNQPGSNFGWILLGEEDNPENARRIASRENTVLAPVLEVEFIPALLPPPATP